jgi:hypothetical protein
LQKNDFEDFTVEIAEMGIEKRARYKQLAATEDDPEVKYIAWCCVETLAKSIDGITWLRRVSFEEFWGDLATL